MVKRYPQNTVKVFSFSGKMIYSKGGYANEWNASYNGTTLPEDTYIFIINTGKSLPLVKGVLTVITN